MIDSREKRAKLNILVSLNCQMITLICGLIVPRVLLRAFGSEAYGATSSIAQFLAYITLLEGGISGVARAALYKPIAENDVEKISQIILQLKSFFRRIAIVFAIYVFILALSYKKISNFQGFDQFSTVLLVFAISISTFAQYFIGITYNVLLNAAQRVYITQFVSIIAVALNTLLILFLVYFNCSLIIVKLISSIVFALKPVAMWVYVKKRFPLVKCSYSGEDMLKQRWTGLGQHLAFFLHSNTDIAILTILADLKQVAVYSIYNMVIANIQTFVTSFSAGMESLFGDMLAKAEYKLLDDTFGKYETIISSIASAFFSTTIVMIIPFVKIYTNGINDINYVNIPFSILLALASLLYCYRQPYHSLITAAGHFKQTRVAAYGEAFLNILISVSLVRVWGLVGVAVGTVISVSFRFVYYAMYISKAITKRCISQFFKRLIVNLFSVILSVGLGYLCISRYEIDNYLLWSLYGFLSFLLSSVLVLFLNYLFYKNDIIWLLCKLRLRKKQ